MRMNVFDYIVLTLVIIGAINWGLIGFFRFDLINVIFGNMTLLYRIIYGIVGLCGLYMISFYMRNQEAEVTLKQLQIGNNLQLFTLHLKLIY